MTTPGVERAEAAEPTADRHARPVRPAAVEAVYAVAHWLLARERAADAAKVFRLMLRMAPRDERAWLGLGECHERIDQFRIAAELYGAGSVIAGAPQSVSIRCLLARARVFATIGRGEDLEATLTLAERAAAVGQDESLIELVAGERARLS